MICKKL